MRTPWLFIFVILLAVTLLCRLGTWQLARAKEKQQSHLAWEAAQHRPAVPLTPTTTQTPFTRVTAIGQFLNEKTILLDNKILNGRVGYHVITPLQLADGSVVLIDRGWISMGTSRQTLPQIPAMLGEVAIEGYLDFAYRNPFVSKAFEEPKKNEQMWPLRVQQLDLSLIADHLDRAVYPMLVKLNSSALKAPGLSAERHLGYAFQWFALALTLCVLAIVFYHRHYRRAQAL